MLFTCLCYYYMLFTILLYAITIYWYAHGRKNLSIFLDMTSMPKKMTQHDLRYASPKRWSSVWDYPDSYGFRVEFWRCEIYMYCTYAYVWKWGIPPNNYYVMRRMMINQCIEGFEAFQNNKGSNWSSLTAFCQGLSSCRMIGHVGSRGWSPSCHHEIGSRTSY